MFAIVLFILASNAQAVVFNDKLSSKQDKEKTHLIKRQYIPGSPVWGSYAGYGSQQNVIETPENVQASYKGLTSYTGSSQLPNPSEGDESPGYPVSLEVDKEDANNAASSEKNKLIKEKEVNEKNSSSSQHNSNNSTISDVKTLSKKNSKKIEKIEKFEKETVKPEVEIKEKLIVNKEETLNERTTTKKSSDTLPNGTVCYLPRIVVNTRLVGATVINEVKIYTNPRDENTVHSFVSSHEITDASSRISHEFLLPPQFVLEKPLSTFDLKYINKVPVMMTTAYTESGNDPVQAARFGPTINPYLPDPNEVRAPSREITNSRPTTKVNSTTTNPTTAATATTTTRPTTASTTTTTTASTTDSVLPPKSLVAKKEKIALEALNLAARRRNALLDVPGGDTAAYSGYQILGPPDVHQSWVSSKRKKKK